MKKLIILILVIGAAATWFFRGRLFVTMPPLTISASHVLVGQPPGDHALYAINAQCEIRAASVGYEFNSATTGFLSKLGARGIISCINADKYKAMENVSHNTGTCMAGFLNDCQSRGEIQHLILVPRDAAALAQMRHASIADGHVFHMKGHYLAYQEGTLGGRRFSGMNDGTGFFLVDAIAQD